MEDQIYPTILDRIKALFVDYLVILALLMAASYIISSFETVSNTIKIISFIFIFLMYDPIFTSLFGGTLGHMAIEIRVKRNGNQNKNIILPAAIIRYIAKSLLGWLSLLTVTGNKQKRAIHDMLAGSVVIFSTKKIKSLLDK